MADTAIRTFDFDKDLASVKRIWREVGWVEDDDQERQLDDFFAVGSAVVGTIDDVPECCVHTVQGSMRLLHTDLSLCCVSAVATSRVARGQQFAQQLTAMQLQDDARAGAAVAVLGVFDQGFYDRLGFGTGGYEHRFSFDPAALKVGTPIGTPQRLSKEHFAQMHRVLRERPLHHGSIVLYPERLFKAELGLAGDGFGLGYYTGERLTHFIWMQAQGERGPYEVLWVGYQNTGQLLQLLALLKSLADQVCSVKFIEPPELQLQAMLERPFRGRALTKASPHSASHTAMAWWQLRVLDVPACVAALEWRGSQPLAFTLYLTDPLARFLEDDNAWRGVGGTYVIRLDACCSAETAYDESLPKLHCSVNAFSRLLWGVAPASSLAVTDEFDAHEALSSALDDGLRMPAARVGWDF